MVASRVSAGSLSHLIFPWHASPTATAWMEKKISSNTLVMNCHFKHRQSHISIGLHHASMIDDREVKSGNCARARSAGAALALVLILALALAGAACPHRKCKTLGSTSAPKRPARSYHRRGGRATTHSTSFQNIKSEMARFILPHRPNAKTRD